MNVLISNERSEELETLGVEVIKSMKGVFSVDDLTSTFKNFYFNKMILDLTALKDYMNISNLQRLTMEIEPEKIILLLPDRPECSSKTYLMKLIALGIYNFTNNVNGVSYLIDHTNTKQDVGYVYNMQNDSNSTISSVSTSTSGEKRVIGFKNITDHAGATTLIYMIKKELERRFGETVYAVEIDRHDFEYFNIRNSISTNKEGLLSTLNKISGATCILVDLNSMNDLTACDEVIYLMEPSSIMLNKLMRTDRDVFSRIGDSKLVLNKSMLNEKDISELEYETKAHVFFNMPPLNDRKKSEDIVEFLTKLGLFDSEIKKTGGFFSLFKN